MNDVESGRVEYINIHCSFQISQRTGVPHLVLAVAVFVHVRIGTATAKTRRGTLGYAVFFERYMYSSRCTQPSYSPHPSLSHESKVPMLRFTMGDTILNKLMNLLISLARDIVVPPLVHMCYH